MPAGRPSKYSSAYCNEVIECLGQGHSVTAFAGQIGVARSTVFKWAEEIPEFSDALKVGQAKAVAFWEKILVEVAKSGKGNATAVIFGLKNRAGDDWADKVVNEHSGPDGGPIQSVDVTPVEAGRRIAFTLSRARRAKPEKS